MVKPLREKSLGEVQTLFNRASRQYSRGNISFEDYAHITRLSSELLETLRNLTEKDEESEGDTTNGQTT